MPVTFGDSTTVSGSGNWSYPDPSVIIGLLVQVETVGDVARSWGTFIPRFRELGVWRSVDEAGPMPAVWLFNEASVTYDIGKSPVSLDYDLSAGTSVTFTEILSEAPPMGGGGMSGGAGLYYYGPGPVAANSSSGISWDTTNALGWTGQTTAGITVPNTGIYQWAFAAEFDCTGPYPDDIKVVLGGSSGPGDEPVSIVTWPGSQSAVIASFTGYAEMLVLSAAGTMFQVYVGAFGSSSFTVTMQHASFIMTQAG